MHTTRKSLAKSAPSADEYVDRGLVYWVVGDISGAIRCYRKAIGIAPASALTHYLLGMTLDEAGRALEARREFDIVLQTTDASTQAQWARGQVTALTGQAPSIPAGASR